MEQAGDIIFLNGFSLRNHHDHKGGFWFDDPIRITNPKQFVKDFSFFIQSKYGNKTIIDFAYSQN